MRLHFQARPWDLFATLGYTLAAGFGLLIANVGNPFALLLVLFAPGYVLVAALFPDNREIDWIERLALSVGLSIAVVPLLGLLLNFTPFGIRLPTVVTAVTAFTVLVGLLAYWRRMSLPAEERLSASLEVRGPAWKDSAALDKVLTMALVVSIGAAAMSLVYVLTTPRPGEFFTEFCVLGPDGKAGGYPTVLNASEPGTVLPCVVNHEFRQVTYTLRIDLVGVDVVYNTTSQRNETVERNRTDLSWANLTLDHGANWTAPFVFSIPAVGLWKVQFLLFKDGDLGTVYRSLHLFVWVT